MPAVVSTELQCVQNFSCSDRCTCRLQIIGRWQLSLAAAAQGNIVRQKEGEIRESDANPGRKTLVVATQGDVSCFQEEGRTKAQRLFSARRRGEAPCSIPSVTSVFLPRHARWEFSILSPSKLFISTEEHVRGLPGLDQFAAECETWTLPAAPGAPAEPR